MSNYSLQLQAAGLGRYQPWQLIVVATSIALLVGSWTQLSFKVLGLSISAAIATVGMLFEAVRLRAKSRSDTLSKLWPEVIESLQSAAKSGIGLIDALDEIGQTGPTQIRSYFREFVARIDRGESFDSSLAFLKSDLGQLHADRLIELIRIVHSSGGAGYLESLKEQGQITRTEIATWGELESKQGWVSGTAKLALVAPWIIVTFLSSRKENVAIYNTNEGLTILLVGLVVSLVAYRFIGILGNLTRPKRVFLS
jgi:tight adherence protein B